MTTGRRKMKRAGVKAKRKPARKKGAARKAGSRQVDITAVRQEATNLIGEEASEMVLAVIEECKKGHYQGMKFLFEIAGIFPAPVAATAEVANPSFAEILCQRLGLPDEMPPEPEVTDDCPTTEADVEHTVE